jgi:hypothetical protein
MRLSVVLFAAAVLLPQVPVRAQEKSGGPPTYKVEFTIHDSGDSAAKGARHYTLLVEEGHKAIFKVGNRVPAASGSFQPGGAALVNTQYTYLDVGVNIECVVGQMNGKTMIHGTLDLSTIAQNDAGMHSSNPPNPTIVQTKLDLESAIDLGKPTVIASIDDPVTTRQFQVVTTVARIN